MSLLPFLKAEGAKTPSTSSHSNLNPFEFLTIHDHNYRSSGSFAATDIISTPPLSPAAESYSALYPAPPHLTPRPSPSTSPRSQTPDFTNVQETNVLGKLHVRVLEACGLRVISGQEKPYVLCSYDRTDSVSREYGAAPPVKTTSEAKKGLKRPIVASRAKGNPGPPVASVTTIRRVGPVRAQSHDGFSSHRTTTTESKPDPIITPKIDPKESGTVDSPTWNHSTIFDVVQRGRTILVCVYDKLAPLDSFPAHGFLGAAVYEPPLEHFVGEDGLGQDVWLPLVSALDPNIGGEIHLRVLFEPQFHRPRLCVDDFQVLKRIGQGSFGQVFRVRKRDSKRIYAMKVISKKNIVGSASLSQVLAERQVLARTLDSPFLVGLKFSFQSATDLFFVIDYKSGGELFTHLQRDGGRFEEDKVRFYISEIILAVEYLHSAGIIYRDIKPENCLLDGSGHVVLVDFGLSKVLASATEMTRTMCGTTAFMAPEILLDVGYDVRCDWWSLGSLLFEMSFGWSPFYADTQVEEYERILTGEIKIPSKKGFSLEHRDLLLKLLTRNPDERIGARGGAKEIQAHPFFASVDWLALARRQVSPPFKPPTVPDEEDSDYIDRGRRGEWMFSGDGECWQNQAVNAKLSSSGSEFDSDGLLRDFTFIAREDDDLKHKNARRSSWTAAP